MTLKQQLYIFNICILSHTHSFGHCRECEVINQADEEDTLYRVATPSVSKGGKGKDFILLASRRKPCDARCGSILHIKHLAFVVPPFVPTSPCILLEDKQVTARLPHASAFITSHDAIFFFFSPPNKVIHT